MLLKSISLACRGDEIRSYYSGSCQEGEELCETDQKAPKRA